MIDAARRFRVLLILLALGRPGTAAAQAPTYPATRRDDVVDDYFGTKVPDPYRWLEQLESPDTVDWVKAQSKLTSRYLGSLPGRVDIERRLESLWSSARTE
ncbi:MAG TPA: hypothetical protein VFW81_03205, partial [Thermoanaerobaculia bacterium]|nr:hypothetical protein [Thermoanaerobaculia bacterium]